ncbi:MAG: type II secretion system protein GspD, partial [Acidisphaera sp.]|nr:type II secretion system protein GspD [Acidisphaera sp.]
MNLRFVLLLPALLMLAACEPQKLPVVEPLQEPLPLGGAAAPRVNGDVGSPDRTAAAQIAYGNIAPVTLPPISGSGGSGGDVSLDFADTDIRAVVAQILGSLLRVNYTIDPSVHGTATLRTSTPLARSQLLPALQTLLAQNGATIVQSGSIYRV